MKIGQSIINRVHVVKYLGVHLDDKLTWTAHTKYVTDRLIKIASTIKIIKHFIPERCKKQIYYAHVYSRIMYGIEAYGYTASNNINQVQVMQNRILKSLYNRDWYTNSNILHKDLQLLQVKDIFHQSILKLVYKQLNGKLPEIFSDYFNNRKYFHNINTRNSNKLNIIQPRTNYGTRTLRFMGSKLYNSLPESIYNSGSLNIFSKQLHRYFLERL